MSTSEENNSAQKRETIEREVREQMDLLVRENARFQHKQMKSLIRQTFDFEDKVYRAKMVEMELDHHTYAPQSEPAEDPTIDVTTSVIHVPLITLIPINTLGITNYRVKITEDNGEISSEVSFDTIQIPVTHGWNTIIQAYGNSIQPIMLPTSNK